MKYYFIALLFSITLSLNAQQTKVYTRDEVDEPAFFFDEVANMQDIVDYLLEDPDAPLSKAERDMRIAIETVEVEFIVTASNVMTDLHIINGKKEEVNLYEKTLVYFLMNLPFWKSAKLNGEAVDSYQRVSISFYEPIYEELEPKLATFFSPAKILTGMSEDRMPEFKGGTVSLRQFIINNLEYPPSAMDEGIEGRVVVRFVVSETGELTDVKVVKKLNPACDEEAVRVIKSMPRWTPARKGGKPIVTYFTLPLDFILPEE